MWNANFFFCRSRLRSFQEARLAQEQLPYNLLHDASAWSNRDGARTYAPLLTHHTIPATFHIQHIGFRTKEHFSPHHRRCAHHTQESANMLPTLCRICSVTELAVCRMHVQTPCIIREYTLQITTVVAPIFFVFGRVSAVSFVATIYRNLPDGCHKVFNTYIHKME